ncbi:ligase-associated DNA damage response endonuclease PdeM [Sungkyunkwania multivorans]|uniref:Ligase-associated DNA damage response endonuclease PdeM n=1 Tax=Sungkyunkwania multivorans TaxID=1173618 RepID=A0ABW3CTL8_9FLAO
MTQTLKISNQTFILHPSGAAFWEAQDMLLVADVHFGKATHFRKHGVAIPNNVISSNFQRIDDITKLFKPTRICFLGDLFHSYINSEWLFFEAWVDTLKAEVYLITGNHDIIPEHKYEALGIQILEEWIIDDFLLTHHPETHDTLFNICGHIHPGVKLKGSGKQSMRLPCFFKTKDQLIFPAFGDFTGKYILAPKKEDQVFAITKKEVICFSATPSSRS